MDQAQQLREQQLMLNKKYSAKIITVTSGKGGVGKTNIVVSLGIALSDMDKKVLLFDADTGLANIDILLNLAPKYNLHHVLKGEVKVSDIIVKKAGGVDILPASSGIQEMSFLTNEQMLIINEELDELFNRYDIIFLDTGAGIGTNVTYFCTIANHIAVIATPEPTSITDAYALMKVLHKNFAQKSFQLIVNNVRNEREAKDIYKKLYEVTRQFMPVSLHFMGYIMSDPNVPKSVREQRSFIDAYPNSMASICVKNMARRITDMLK